MAGVGGLTSIGPAMKAAPAITMTAAAAITRRVMRERFGGLAVIGLELQ
jgi:hypothetical protein